MKRRGEITVSLVELLLKKKKFNFKFVTVKAIVPLQDYLLLLTRGKSFPAGSVGSDCDKLESCCFHLLL